MNGIKNSYDRSSVIELLTELDRSDCKSLEYICSKIGEPQRTCSGDPLRCRRDSLSCMWNIDGVRITMYFDPEKICFGIDVDHIMISIFPGIHSNQRLVKLIKNFI